MSLDRAQQATYRESTAPALGRGVRSWIQTVPASASLVEQLHLPHGGVEVRWHRHRSPTVVGPANHPTLEVIHPGDEVVGFRFAPGWWPEPADGSMTELVDGVSPLKAIAGLARDAEHSNDVDTRRAVLQRALAPLSRAARGGPVGALVDAVHLRDQRASEIAATTGWSERHVRRQVLRATGLPVRDLRRIGRFQRFVALVQHDVAHQRRRPSVELAIVAGYSDQSHLQRACRRLAGLTLTAYLDRTHDHCAGHDHPQTGRCA